MTDQQPLVGVQIGPDFSPDIWTDLELAQRGTRGGEKGLLTVALRPRDLSILATGEINGVDY